ncbi:tetratricopeptide repeat protein [Thermovibrio sp.]
MEKKDIPEAKVCLGRLELKQGNLKKARKLFESSLKDYPGISNYWIGISYLKEGLRKEAVQYLFKANINGFVNNLYFKLTRYISFDELNRLETSAKKHPILYLYLGDYFYRNKLFDGALFYYQLALRYNIEEAKYKSALTLYKLGNFQQAYNILVSLYKEGSVRAASYLADIFLWKAQDALKGCFLLIKKDPSSYLKRRILSIKESLFFLKERNKWLKIVKNKKELTENEERIDLLLGKRKQLLENSLLSIDTFNLERLCNEGHLWAEYILAMKLKKLPASSVAISFYRKMFYLAKKRAAFK